MQSGSARTGSDAKGQSASELYQELGVERSILSQNEKRVLFGMVRFPNLNDRKISERIGLKLSTFTAIKNRLKKSDYFRQVRLPNMESLGKELAFVSCIPLNPSQPSMKVRGQVTEQMRGWGDLFYAVTGTQHLIVMGYSDDYSNLRKRWDERMRSLLSGGVVDGHFEADLVVFPLSQTAFPSAFDYSGILESCFDVEYSGSSKSDGNKGAAVQPEPQDARTTGMGAIERRVLCGLIEHPDMPDNTLAREVKTTRQAVARIKKRLEKRGVLRTVKVPELRRLGLEVLSFSHLQLLPEAVTAVKSPAQPGARSPVFFQCQSTTDMVCLGAHRNFTEFWDFRSRLVSQFSKRGIIGEIRIVPLPMSLIEPVRTFDFKDMVKKAVERP